MRRRVAMWFGLLGAAVPAGAQDAAAIRQLRDWNLHLSRLPASAETRGEIEQRARLLSALMQSDPKAALDLALPPATASALRAMYPDLADQIDETGPLEGVLQTYWADDFEGDRAWRWFRLRRADRELEVYFSGEAPAFPCEQTVELSGLRLGDRFVVDASLPVLPREPRFDSCSLTGNQPTVVLLVSMPASAIPATVTPSALRPIFFSTTGRSLNTFWHENSFGRTTASGDIFQVTLNENYTCDQPSQMLTAAIAAADPVVDFRNYTRMFVVFRPVGACSYGGLGGGCGRYTSADGSFHASASWLTVGNQLHSENLLFLAAHEGGHNLGLAHASSLKFPGTPLGPIGAAGTTSEYGDPFATMGTGPVGHYSAKHKLQLGWLTAAEIPTVDAGGTFTIAPYSQAGTLPKALKVRRGVGTEAWLWLEWSAPRPQPLR